MNVILADLVDDDLHCLRTVRGIEHHWLIKVHMLLRQISIIHHQLKVSVLMLVVSFLQTNLERALALELLCFRKVEFREIALALLLEKNKLVMRMCNRSGKLCTSAG